jgi:hypothetical protein
VQAHAILPMTRTLAVMHEPTASPQRVHGPMF